MAISDMETPITYFANPFLKCAQAGCNRRAVGVVGAVLGTSLATLTLPAGGRNWPCYHAAGRISVCSNWTSTTGCQHTTEQRAQHSNQLTFEGTRR